MKQIFFVAAIVVLSLAVILDDGRPAPRRRRR